MTGISEDIDSMQGLVAAAHELKTPLAIIAHLAAAMEDGLLDEPATRRASLQRIQLAAERTMRLFGGLTKSYQVHEAQASLKLKLTPINMGQVCEEVAHEITPFVSLQQQDINLHLGQKPQLVVGDRELLYTVLFNLLDNAVRHSPPQTTVDIDMRRRSDVVRVCVRDNGPGLSSSDITKLQQRLGKRMQPITTRSSGSGLGLYIAQQLVSAMGGRLGVGRMEAGADFHIDLLHSAQLSLL